MKLDLFRIIAIKFMIGAQGILTPKPSSYWKSGLVGKVKNEQKSIINAGGLKK